MREHLSSLALPANEIFLADKGYQGHEQCLTGFKNSASEPVTWREEVVNEVLDSVRQIVECTFKRIKDFGILGSAGAFRYSRDKHRPVFNVCAQITNIKLEREPLWANSNKLLF